MTLPPLLRDRLSLPLIGSPMFIISQPDLVIAQCRSGIVGAFPSLNARPSGMFEQWLQQLAGALTEQDAPFAVNLIVHRTNTRLEEDLELCVRYRVPIVITSLGDPSPFENQNLIRIPYGTHPVGNDDRGSILQVVLEILLYLGLTLGIETAGRFIQEKNRRLRIESPSNPDPLTLSSRNSHPSFAHNRLLTHGHLLDEFIDQSEPGRANQSFLVHLDLTQSDIFSNRAVKKSRLLQDAPHLTTQTTDPELLDIDAIE